MNPDPFFCLRSFRPVRLSVVAIAMLSLVPVPTHASLPNSFFGLFPTSLLTSVAAAPGGGFWVQVDKMADFGVRAETLAKEGAPAFPDVPIPGSVAAIPGRNGYWIVTDDGQIHARGDAPELCGGKLSNCSGFPKSPVAKGYIVAAAATPSGNGLWAVGRDGSVWTAGNAQALGDVQRDPAVPTGIVATPSGNGYYIVSDDGGVFSFGDALFFGSTGGKKPGGHAVTGLALSIGADGQVNGYWLVAEDGGIFTFGSAPFWGASGGNNGGNSVTSIVSFPAPVPPREIWVVGKKYIIPSPPQRTRGYAWVSEDGSVSAVYRPPR
jgi:hypothetical protein